MATFEATIITELEVPNVHLKSYGDRVFSVAAPKQWNEIPLDIKIKLIG